jgi:hypothetical protein
MGNQHCQGWWDQFKGLGFTLFLIPFSITAFNGGGKFVLDKMTVAEQFWQKSDEMYSAAMKMSILTIINTGCVIMLIDNANGTLFKHEWYSSSGSSICLTLILGTFINNGVNLAFAFLGCVLRWLDRGFTCSKKDENGKEVADQATR